MDQEHVILSFQLSCSGKCFPFQSNSHGTYVEYFNYNGTYVTADTADMVPTVVLAIQQILHISD